MPSASGSRDWRKLQGAVSMATLLIFSSSNQCARVYQNPGTYLTDLSVYCSFL
jgi:hypothetical protein